MPLISIIIPIYNVAPYIEQCLNSVINQTYKDIEALLVDDCGTDNSIDIANRIINEYEGPITFQIIHHDHNRGLSAARNTGIEASHGEWLYFLDSDDWIIPECIEKLVIASIQESPVDMVMGNIKVVGANYDWHFLSNGVYNDGFVEKACSYQIYTMAWNKLLKKSFIINNSLFFEEGLCHEDVLWNIQVSCFLTKIVSIDYKTYNYVVREGSIQTNESEQFHHIHMSKVWLSLISFIFNRGFDDDKNLYLYVINNIDRYICCKREWAYDFYCEYRKLPFWSLCKQCYFGSTYKRILFGLNRKMPIIIGFKYYRYLYNRFNK